MGRLKALPSRLQVLPSRVAYLSPEESEQARNRKRDSENAWRGWYKTPRWKVLRLKVIKRDKWICQQTGALLIGKHPAPNSPVVDHIRPHRGDPKLFWDETNLQTVSKAYHDSVKQALERATG